MGKLTKNQKKALELYDPTKSYTIEEASEIVKKITFSKFDSSVDLDIRLGVDPKKADQMVRGVVTLPNGVGKEVKVLVLCTPEKEEEANVDGDAPQAGGDTGSDEDNTQEIKLKKNIFEKKSFNNNSLAPQPAIKYN